MPFLWQIPDGYPEEAIGDYDREASPDRFLLRKACGLGGSFGVATVRFKVSGDALREFDELPNSSMTPLVSERLKSLLSGVCPLDVEFLPTNVIAANGRLSGYSLLNVVHAVKATNLSQSAVVPIPGTQAIMKFNRLRLLEGCMGEHQLARNADYLSHILVGDGLAKEMLREKISGVRLAVPEEIHP